MRDFFVLLPSYVRSKSISWLLTNRFRSNKGFSTSFLCVTEATIQWVYERLKRLATSAGGPGILDARPVCLEATERRISPAISA